MDFESDLMFGAVVLEADLCPIWQTGFISFELTDRLDAFDDRFGDEGEAAIGGFVFEGLADEGDGVEQKILFLFC